MPEPTAVPKAWYTSRTLWLNAIAFVVMVLSLPELGAFVPASWRPVIGAIVAVANMVLRFGTTQPLASTEVVEQATAEARVLRSRGRSV